MYLYTICDDSFEVEETWWIAVWAHTEGEALAHARAHYDGECDEIPVPLYIAQCVEQTDAIKPRELLDNVATETRREILRLAGWHVADELQGGAQ